MTSPSDTPGNADYWFGRIDGKIDQLGDKMGHLTETVGRHDERIRNVEQDTEELKSARISDQHQKSTDRGGVRAAVSGAVTGALISGVFLVVQLLLHK